MATAVLLESGDAYYGDEMSNSHLLWDNALEYAESVTANKDDDNVVNLFHHNTTQKWAPGNGTSEVDVVFSTARSVNCMGLAAGNFGSTGATIELWDRDPSRAPVKLAEVNGLADRAPHMMVFNHVTSRHFRLIIRANAPLKLGQFALGVSMNFPCRPTIGLELGKFNNADKEFTTITEGLEFTGTSTQARVRPTKIPFKHVPMSWIRDSWVPFSNGHKGKPVWMIWDSVNFPEDTVYGMWKTESSIRYTKSTYTELTLVITGHVR